MSTTAENMHQKSIGERKRHGLLSRIPIPSKKSLFAIGLSGALVATGGWEIYNLGQSSRDSELSKEQTNGDKRVDVALNLGRAGITNTVAVEIGKGKTLVTLSLDPIKPDSCHVTFSYEQIPNGTEPTLRMEQHDEGGNAFSRIAIHDGETAKQVMEDLCN